MMVKEDFEYYKNDMLSRKKEPYVFNDFDYAWEFFTLLKVDYPTAKFYFIQEFGEIITLDAAAEKKLAEMLQKRIDRLKEDLGHLEIALSECMS